MIVVGLRDDHIIDQHVLALECFCGGVLDRTGTASTSESTEAAFRCFHVPSGST